VDAYRTYEEGVYVERFSVAVNASERSLRRHNTLAYLNGSPRVAAYVAREGRRPRRDAGADAGGLRRFAASLDHGLGAAGRFAASFGYYAAIASAIHRRARAESVAPDVVVALDLYALAAAAGLRRAFGCSLVYDSHELWPYADLLSERWEPPIVARLEKHLLRGAHAVVTVSPPLARILEDMYRIDEVRTVPNAAPLESDVEPSSERPPSEPVKFLLQGGVAPGRGVDVLLDGWRGVDPSRAKLYLRCPANAYLAGLRVRFSDLWETGRVEQLEPVLPARLVQAASFADVGVIPYVGPNPNHLYCCPNKLSQYMQAGLAVLSNDLPYVSTVIRSYRCGTTYSSAEPRTVAEAVATLTTDLEQLRRMKERSRAAALREFNWDCVSGPYRDALESALTAAKAA
jgi:glycosyltransferase involved in cell wall biosynthesis